jgi:beta-alanine--pyruvate transaminase
MGELDAFWMPFTAGRQFRARPRMLTGAKDMHYVTDDGREVLDGTAGLWCTNLGHGREEITRAVADQMAQMDYAPSYQMGHPLAFELAERLVELAPAPFKHVFFTNSGSESVDTALKIALAYQNLRGKGERLRIIGRHKGYHGTGFGGMAVGGMGNNRQRFGPGLPVDHLSHTLLPDNAFSRGLPANGAAMADELLDIIGLHGADTIAAVIIEPISGSAGIIVPPTGYLERIRGICTDHDIVLIFDEVITAFGRLGAAFAAEEFGVVPDIMTTAKGLTNGTIPMGAVLTTSAIHEVFMHAPPEDIEFFHGYTYSGHPVACRAALASLDLYARDEVFTHARKVRQVFEDCAHELATSRANVTDVRNYGLMAGIEIAPRDGPSRTYEIFEKCFFEEDLMIRFTGNVLAISPPLIISEAQIRDLFDKVGRTIDRVN